jgi:sporulation protein YlmC with PRC-barrel domain
MIARTMTLSVAAVALAVATSPISPSLAADVVDLEMWNAEDLHDGWRASSMTDVAVYGEDGEDIGEVANIIVGPDDQVQSIIVEAGGLFDIGDTHFRVPWDQVDLTPGAEGVQVPVNEDNVDDFDLFGDEPGAGPRSWRVSEVMGDYVRLEDGVNYGIVDDLIFDDGGKLKSIVVNPSVGYGVGGYYAYPWYGYDYGFDPGQDFYDLPYGRDDVAAYEPFDYGVYDDDIL